MTETIETFTKTSVVHTDRYVYLYIHILIFVSAHVCKQIHILQMLVVEVNEYIL